MLKKCIICEKEKDMSLFNEEHIIPESLGNTKLKTYDVCTECNNLIGSKVDSELTSNFFSEIYRWHKKIRGKKGAIPNPFSHGKTKDGRIVHVDEKMNPNYVQVLKFNKSTGELSLGGDFDKGIVAINKKLSRSGQPLLTEAQVEEWRKKIKVEYTHPEIGYDFEVDTNRLILAFMKIAYEYGHEYLGEKYTNDPVAQEIRYRIYDYIYNDKMSADLQQYEAPIPTDSVQEWRNIINALKAQTHSDRIHMLVTCNLPHGGILFVLIDDHFTYGIKFCGKNEILKKRSMVAVLYPSGHIIEE